MFEARFHDLACQALGNLNRFHNASPLGGGAGNIGTRGYVTALFQRLNMQTMVASSIAATALRLRALGSRMVGLWQSICLILARACGVPSAAEGFLSRAPPSISRSVNPAMQGRQVRR